jgi:hypothetical protein
LLAAGGLAEEYKNATIKGRGERGTVILEVGGQQVKVTPTLAMKSFDTGGKPIQGSPQDPGDLIAAWRVLKEGNVINVKTEKSKDGKTEFIREIRLVKGELLQAGKASTTTGGRKTATGETKTYKNATIKAVDKSRIVLTTDQGEEVTVKASFRTQAYANGRLLSRESRLRVFKEGNVVDVTVEKKGQLESIVEARLVKGELAPPRK